MISLHPLSFLFFVFVFVFFFVSAFAFVLGFSACSLEDNPSCSSCSIEIVYCLKYQVLSCWKQPRFLSQLEFEQISVNIFLQSLMKVLDVLFALTLPMEAENNRDLLPYISWQYEYIQICSERLWVAGWGGFITKLVRGEEQKWRWRPAAGEYFISHCSSS